MKEQTNSRAPRRYLETHWPAFLLAYSVMVAGILIIGIGLVRGWYSLIPFALIVILAGAYSLLTGFWFIWRLYGMAAQDAAEVLFAYSQAQAHDRLVCVDLGLRNTAISLARHLTSGEVIVVDVYNPLSNTSAALRRARAQVGRPKSDPRLTWIDGNIELMPLPDASVSAVFLNEILSEFWLVEERHRLLAEVQRILIPHGRLLLAEQVRTQSNVFLAGPMTVMRPTAGYWKNLLVESGFTVQREDVLKGVIYCARADKPPPTAGQQLALGLEYV